VGCTWCVWTRVGMPSVLGPNEPGSGSEPPDAVRISRAKAIPLLVYTNSKQYVMATGAKRSGATLCFCAETKGGSTSLAMTVSYI
jgi:hypothetical protein